MQKHPTNRIEQLRTDRQISINTFCEVVGISRKTYYNYKIGRPIPSDKLVRMAQLFGCSVEYILGLKDFTQICVTDKKGNLICSITDSVVIEHNGYKVIFAEG